MYVYKMSVWFLKMLPLLANEGRERFFAQLMSGDVRDGKTNFQLVSKQILSPGCVLTKKKKFSYITYENVDYIQVSDCTSFLGSTGKICETK